MTPRFQLLADGQDFTRLAGDRLISLLAVDHAGEEADRLSVTLDDRDHRLAFPRKGATLELHLGYAETGLALVGRYIADEVSLSGPVATLRIDARAADLRDSFKERRTQSWEHVTLAAIASEIAARHGLEARWDGAVAVIGQTLFPHIDQADESDLHFLTRLARQHGLLAKPAGPYLLLLPRGRGTKASGDALPGLDLRPHDLRRWLARFPDRDRWEGVSANYTDLDTAERVRVTAGSDARPVKHLREVFASEAEAQAAAEAEWARLRRAEATLDLELARGAPRAVAGGRIQLGNPSSPGPGPRFRPEVTGLWIATTVRHRLDRETGLTTEIEAEQPSE